MPYCEAVQLFILLWITSGSCKNDHRSSRAKRIECTIYNSSSVGTVCFCGVLMEKIWNLHSMCGHILMGAITRLIIFIFIYKRNNSYLYFTKKNLFPFNTNNLKIKKLQVFNYRVICFHYGLKWTTIKLLNNLHCHCPPKLKFCHWNLFRLVGPNLNFVIGAILPLNYLFVN